MTRALLIAVRFHDGRYHGSGDWPPSPARLFQALVAGAARERLDSNDYQVLTWLESLAPPIIATPTHRPGQSFDFFVPNNDLDAFGGDVRKVGKIRTAEKRMRPRLFDAGQPFLYAWTFERSDENQASANVVSQIAERLYQLGRGVDMAWANGEVIDSIELDRRLDAYPGVVFRPCVGNGGSALDCPELGSLDSLCIRYQAKGQRFTATAKGKQLFTQAPKPHFRSVPYNSPPTYLLFDLRDSAKPDSPFAPQALERSAGFVQELRGRIATDGKPKSGAAKRLWDALPGMQGEISSALIGRDSTEADKSRRVRIVPLPSIGHVHVSRDIRRVLIEIPPNCPVRADDIAWSFSGLEVAADVDDVTGELLSSIRLVTAGDRSMLDHYGMGDARSARVWRSVTPLALPETTRRRRIDPARYREEAKSGSERLGEHQAAVGAILQALRHADVRAQVYHVRAQREPFEARGARAEMFAPGSRFPKERLWHAEITFATPVSGPLILGDGRYAGMGLMAPSGRNVGVHALSIVEGLSDTVDTVELARALRRAVMARVQGSSRARELPLFFTGHEADGAPARRGRHAHLAFVPDLLRRRLLIVAPHLIEHREPLRSELPLLHALDEALAGFDTLRAGKCGLLVLKRQDVDIDKDPLFTAARVWVSSTPYLATRRGSGDEAVFLAKDGAAEASRRNLPAPKAVTAHGCGWTPDGRLISNLRLEFNVAVTGPIMLGASLHFGGGLFAGAT